MIAESYLQQMGMRRMMEFLNQHQLPLELAVPEEAPRVDDAELDVLTIEAQLIGFRRVHRETAQSFWYSASFAQLSRQARGFPDVRGRRRPRHRQKRRHGRSRRRSSLPSPWRRGVRP